MGFVWLLSVVHRDHFLKQRQTLDLCNGEEFHFLLRYGLNYQIKENEVGGTCGTHGRRVECVQVFDGKVRRKETTWKTKT
jgi:hypothetical protein